MAALKKTCTFNGIPFFPSHLFVYVVISDFGSFGPPFFFFTGKKRNYMKTVKHILNGNTQFKKSVTVAHFPGREHTLSPCTVMKAKKNQMSLNKRL